MSDTPSLSPQFAARLKQLSPQARVRVIVLLQVAAGNGRRQSREERQAAIAAVSSAAHNALGEIDAIIKRHDGKRLSAPNAIGAISVEVTVEGIHEIAQSSLVQAVLEDQSLSLPFTKTG